MEIFKDYAYYYNFFNRDKDYRAEALQVDRLLKNMGGGISRIIDFGCGTGQHDFVFYDLGYHCNGIDMSSRMINIAKKSAWEKRAELDFSVADIRNYKTKEKYDAVISLFHVLSYQNKNEDVLATFRSARCALDRGGVFLFDVWYGPGVLSEKPSVRVKEIEDGQNRLVRIARPVMHDKENTVDVCYEVFVIEKDTGMTKIINEVHHMRYFFRPELDYYLQEAGFGLIDNFDCKTLGDTDYDSWTSYFVARAL